MVVVSVEKLANIYNPLLNPPWRESVNWDKPIYKEEILELAKTNLPRPQEYNSFQPESREDHIKRIAYYVKHGWGEGAIKLNFNWGDWPIDDGNHRFLAAIIREDKFILANWEGSRAKLKSFIYD